MKRVTIKEVAKEASVSSATVSHVINKTRYVSAETSERVQKALEKLNYSPNLVARSLRGGQTKTIGLLLPDMSNLFFAEIARKIEDYGFLKGYSVIIGNSDNNVKKQSNYINTLIAKQVDGIILISSGGDPDDLRPLIKNNMPVVIADRNSQLDFADVVLIDNEKAGYNVGNYLAQLGHKEIGCITGPKHLSPNFERLVGFQQALMENKISLEQKNVIQGDFSIKSGDESFQRLFSINPKLTAIFTFNDLMAFGVMAAAKKKGLILPEDLSVVGFDDIELSSVVTPTLTTVSQPTKIIAETSVNLLIEKIEGERINESNRILLDAKLIERGSTIRICR